jgi:hypothetical protein
MLSNSDARGTDDAPFVIDVESKALEKVCDEMSRQR